jgi:pyrroline-5-carboxylate reductase
VIIGFIGTGKIASSIITGISKSNLYYKKIFISVRNRKTSLLLKKKFKKIVISDNNQNIINSSDLIFLSVTPDVGNEILKVLNFQSKQTIISLISTIKFSQLKKMIKVNANIIRAIPLPPISQKEGPIPIYPPNKKAKEFFNHLGTTIEIKNEKLLNNFWSTSGMMASYYNMLDTICVWLNKRGVKKLDAQKYVTSLFLALSRDAVINSDKDLKLLVQESQTPKGLNEQGLKKMIKKGVYKSIINTLNSVYKRLHE